HASSPIATAFQAQGSFHRAAASPAPILAAPSIPSRSVAEPDLLQRVSGSRAGGSFVSVRNQASVPNTNTGTATQKSENQDGESNQRGRRSRHRRSHETGSETADTDRTNLPNDNTVRSTTDSSERRSNS